MSSEFSETKIGTKILNYDLLFLMKILSRRCGISLRIKTDFLTQNTYAEGVLDLHRELQRKQIETENGIC